MLRCEFIFDFASPNAYLAQAILPGIEARQGVKFDYTLVFLGGMHKESGNQPPMIAFQNVPNKLRYIQLEIERFIKRHQIDRFRINPHFPVHTLQIMRGALAAQEENLLERYMDIVNRAMWEDGLKMDDAEIIARALTDGGLDAEALIAKSQTDAIKQKLINNTREVVERGAFGIPTFFIGDEIFFGKDSLELVEEEIAKQKAG